VVYGTIDITSGGVQTNYSVDGAPPVTVTSQAGPGDTFNQQFWMSPILSVGNQYASGSLNVTPITFVFSVN